jgi:DNA replication protein DnaC
MRVLTEESIRKLRELNLSELIDVLNIQSQDPHISVLPFEERMNMIVDYIYQEKHNKKVHRLIKLARFRISNASVHNIHYVERGLDKSKITGLSSCQFIDTHTSIVFNGFTGSGKSYLACAIGKQACMLGIRTRYIRIPDLLMLRDEATLKPQGISKLLKKFSGYKLLILDEFLFDDLNDEEKFFLFELIERRHDNTSTIYCTQFRKEDWHERLGGDIHADAMMDRIVHNAIWTFTGDMNICEYFAKKE